MGRHRWSYSSSSSSEWKVPEAGVGYLEGTCFGMFGSHDNVQGVGRRAGCVVLYHRILFHLHYLYLVGVDGLWRCGTAL